jgi:succinate dehydrogenase/fumarate reductase-like Fe-S protein
MEKKVKLRIFRFIPDIGIPEYKEYEVPMGKGHTVLKTLFYIAENNDDPPAFRRYFCNRGQCAGCIMTINHRTRRACTTQVREDMVIEPLYDYPVIRDLVVDFGKKVYKEPGRYYRAKTGTTILSSNFRLKDQPLANKKLFMKIDQDRCLYCKEKPCVKACWVNLYENLENKEGERLPLYSEMRWMWSLC